MEAVHGIKEHDLDLILHSPGGSPEAAEAIVDYLRSKFDRIRVIVPHMAMSAATMIACAADEIVMGSHSSIGPIDPQVTLTTSLGVRSVPAQAIIEQFERAIEECKDPAKMRAWIPMLNQYGPDLLRVCQNATELGKFLVAKWLTENMFKGEPDGPTKATAISEWLGTHSNFWTHGRPISRETAIAHGLKISKLEENSELQDAVLSVYHATSHTFASTGAVKIIENHHGSAFIIQMQQILIGEPPGTRQGQGLPALRPALEQSPRKDRRK